MEMYPEKLKSVSNGIKNKWWIFSIFFLLLAILSYMIIGSLHRKRSFFEIPIVFSSDGSPCIQATVQGMECTFELDSGGSCYFSLKPELFDKIDCIKEDLPIHWYDIKGNEYSSSVFSVNGIQIQRMHLSQVPVIEEDSFFHNEGSLLKAATTTIQPNHLAGRIGSRTLRSHDYWLLDLPNSALFAIKDLQDVKDNPRFSFEGFAEVSLEQFEPHIVISIETDFGLKKFAIDTGAYRSILRSSSELNNHEIITTDRFIIGEKDFGSTQLYLFNISDHMGQFDGFLGRDFLETHAVYLDFKNKRVFVGPTVQKSRLRGFS